MIISRNADVPPISVNAIEGKPMYGGDLKVKPLIKGSAMTCMEIHYQPGVGSAVHTHSHESLVYIVRGKVKVTVADESYILESGDVCRHPKGVAHSVEAIEETVMVEIKSPAPNIADFFQTN